MLVVPAIEKTYSPSFSASESLNSAFQGLGAAGFSAFPRNPRSDQTTRVMSVIRGKARNVLSDDERVDVVRALVGIDRLEVAHVAHRGVLVDDAVAAQDVARHAGDLEGLEDVVALRHRDLDEGRLPLVLEAPQLEAEELGLGDLGHHLDELPLDELVA